MIPSKEQRAEWRDLAINTVMTSGLGEYTPDEVLILLDAVDELEAEVERLKACLPRQPWHSK